MPKLETIEDFYKETIGWLPDSLRRDIGHFNVFKSDPYVGSSPKQRLTEEGISIKSHFATVTAR